VASFGFTYADSYGRHGLSQRYAGPTTTGQSYGTGVAIRAGDTGQKVTDLYVVYGTVGTHAAAVVDHPITRGVPDTANPVKTTTGTFTVPGDFASMPGYTFNSSGRIVVSCDTCANAEIRGSAALGY
jgi:hypothetical protein